MTYSATDIDKENQYIGQPYNNLILYIDNYSNI